MDPIPYSNDLFGALPTTKADVQFFYTANETALTPNWQTWYKPTGATMCSMIAIGGGGGGAATPTVTTGGGGGGSSGIARLILPAFFLPDILYVQVGLGGSGATNNAGAGGLSYISFGHSNTSPNVLLVSNNAAPGGGSGATAGAASTIAVVQPFGNFGIFSAIAGQGGSAGGGANAQGSALAAWGTVPVGGGVGGSGNGGAGRAGLSMTVATVLDWGEGPALTVAGSTIVAGGATNSAGDPGFSKWQPFFNTGGVACGSTTALTFTSGRGGVGSGGGGASATNNLGGNGGNGLVVITSW
jgi:hypothetical protein